MNQYKNIAKIEVFLLDLIIFGKIFMTYFISILKNWKSTTKEPKKYTNEIYDLEIYKVNKGYRILFFSK